MLSAVQSVVRGGNAAAPPAGSAAASRTALPGGGSDAPPSPAGGGGAPGPGAGSMLDIVKQFAANPELGAAPAPRTPGSFGPFDEASEGHIFLGPLDKGITEGIARGFGLRSPSEGIGDVLKDTWENLVAGAKDTFQKIADYRAPEGSKTAFDTEGILSGRIPAAIALTVPAMTARGIGGMADLLEQGGSALKEGLQKNDHQRIGQGVGMILGSLAQIAMGMKGGEEAESAAGKVGAT